MFFCQELNLNILKTVPYLEIVKSLKQKETKETPYTAGCCNLFGLSSDWLIYILNKTSKQEHWDHTLASKAVPELWRSSHRLWDLKLRLLITILFHSNFRANWINQWTNKTKYLKEGQKFIIEQLTPIIQVKHNLNIFVVDRFLIISMTWSSSIFCHIGFEDW